MKRLLDCTEKRRCILGAASEAMLTLTPDDLTFIGHDLVRPECVLATRAGVLYASHGEGGISCLFKDGRSELIRATSGDVPEGFIPNGYSLMPDGRFLIANVGASGGVFILARDGSITCFLDEIDGQRLPATNFANYDAQGRVWISVSTTATDRDRAFNKEIANGYVILVDEQGARIVVDDICFANENKVDPSGEWLYVHETMGRALIRFPIADDNSLGLRQTVAEYESGIFPDGFEFDAHGGIWCTSVVSNRVVRIDADGTQHTVLDAGDPELVARAELAYQCGEFSRELLNGGRDSILGNCASIGFGGDDLKTAFLGSLQADRITSFRVPVAGAVPPHWHF